MTNKRTTTTKAVPVRPVKSLALKQEMGRRRNNKARRANGQPTVRTKAYYLAAFDRREIDALLAGEVVTKTYASGRVESYKVSA
jgi:hypothetical protein